MYIYIYIYFPYPLYIPLTRCPHPPQIIPSQAPLHSMTPPFLLAPAPEVGLGKEGARRARVSSTCVRHLNCSHGDKTDVRLGLVAGGFWTGTD